MCTCGYRSEKACPHSKLNDRYDDVTCESFQICDLCGDEIKDTNPFLQTPKTEIGFDPNA